MSARICVAVVFGVIVGVGVLEGVGVFVGVAVGVGVLVGRGVDEGVGVGLANSAETLLHPDNSRESSRKMVIARDERLIFFMVVSPSELSDVPDSII
jgi:hypothetical protein